MANVYKLCIYNGQALLGFARTFQEGLNEFRAVFGEEGVPV